MNEESLTSAEIKVFSDYNQYMIECAQEENRIYNRIIRAIVSVLGETYVKEMEEIMKQDCSCYGPYALVKSPAGKPDELLYEYEPTVLTEVYINQTTNGGYTGDEYSGEFYFKLKDRLWLKCYYSC